MNSLLSNKIRTTHFQTFKTAIVVLAFLSCYLLAGQKVSKNLYAFEKFNEIPVISQVDTLRMPWAGGMNEPLVNSIDLDIDGFPDLVVYDKANHSYQTFLAKGTPGNRFYEYTPQYESFFPGFNINSTWALTRDFNCDGKKDLFFNVGGDIFVWENTSGQALSFTPANNGKRMETDDPTPINLYIATINLPGIADIDGDNALDILTYSNVSIEMEYHKGKTPCGLDFTLYERCWGHFTESGTSQGATLNACQPHRKKTMDIGSALLPIDLNGDQVKDLVFGSIGFDNLFALYNGGTADSAHMISQDVNYPTSKPITFQSFPGMTYEDVNFDNNPDLLVASRANLYDRLNKNSLHLYKNSGSASVPNFSFEQNDFLQGEMIDVGQRSVPRLADLNGDSLLDLVVSNFNFTTSGAGSQHSYYYYENTGSVTSPEFTLVDTNFMDISSFGILNASIPTFGDLDGDGDLDALIGQMDGTISYFTNQSSTSPSFSLSNSNIVNIAPRKYAAPFLFDLDSNGTLDLVVGNDKGTLYNYINSSTTNPSFVLGLTQFGGVNIPPLEGYSTPCLIKNNGVSNLFVGSHSSGVFQFDSLAKVSNAPAVLQPILGTGNIVSANSDESPLGLGNVNGRNQILIRGSEMTNAGLVSGYINGISLNVTTTPNNTVEKLAIRIKHTKDTVLDNFQTDFEPALSEKMVSLTQGWGYIEFDYPFLWDGGSGIVIEICHMSQRNSPDIHVKMTDVGFNANAYGDYVDSGLNVAGCSQAYEASSHLRPNLRIVLKPAFQNTANYFEGMHTAPAVADLDHDGFLDMIVGNMSGGLTYYKGKIYDVGIEEPPYKGVSNLNVYPNPGNGKFIVNTPYSGNAEIFVFDLSGRQVQSIKVFQEETEVNLERHPKGMYIFIYKSDESIKTAKVIKQ